MRDHRKTGRHLILFSWSGLVLWQFIWHAILPVPGGNANWILAILASIPLLMFTAGVVKTRHKPLTWGMFLVMLYFIVGVMESWSNADQRFAASIQIILTCVFFLGLVLFTRPVLPDREQ
ncbi:MAG: putative membrane protein [Lysobacterales bacterium]|jgi:uncharacterized membrane protein